jgi:hypothetical protein
LHPLLPLLPLLWPVLLLPPPPLLWLSLPPQRPSLSLHLVLAAAQQQGHPHPPSRCLKVLHSCLYRHLHRMLQASQKPHSG